MIRFAVVMACLVPLTLALLPLQLLALRYDWDIRRTLPHLYHRIVCRLIGVRVRTVGCRDGHGPLLILANHVSWLDICVISAMTPVSFVAKSEVADWPVFGWLAKLQRTVFIDRQARQRTGEATAEIGARLAAGEAIVLFAEGTSGDGSRVLPFRSALIGAVHIALGDDDDSTIAVQPMAVTYTGFGGLPIGRELRERVAWYGDADLIPHFVGLLKVGAVDVTVSWGAPIAPAIATDRKAIARTAETSVRQMSEAARRAGVQGTVAARPNAAATRGEPQFEPA